MAVPRGEGREGKTKCGESNDSLSQPVPLPLLCHWLQVQEFRPDPAGVAVEDGDTARQIETLFAGITRVEKQCAANGLVEWLVGVAEDHYIRALTNDAPLNGLRRLLRGHDVMQEKFPATNFGQFRFPEIESDVVVAEHGGDRGDLFQLKNQPRHPDVAAVQDVVHAGEQFWYLGVEETVRVGNRADFHCVDSGRCQWSVAICKLSPVALSQSWSRNRPSGKSRRESGSDFRAFQFS